MAAKTYGGMPTFSRIDLETGFFIPKCLRYMEETALRNCNETPPQELFRAIRQFNGGDWFECHETLEDLWVGEQGEIRDFYQGILQIAVALHHRRNGNFGGALRLLESGASYLRRVNMVCQGVDVAGLIEAADRMREGLAALGPENMADLDPSLIPRLRVIPP